MLQFEVFDLAGYSVRAEFAMTTTKEKVDQLVDWMLEREGLPRFSAVHLSVFDGDADDPLSRLEIQLEPDRRVGNLYYDGKDVLRSYCGYESESYETFAYPDATGHSVDYLSSRYHLELPMLRAAVKEFVTSGGDVPQAVRWLRVPESGLANGEDPFHHGGD